GVARAQHGAQPVSHRHQQPVAGVMAEAVVHHLEAIEVEEQHGQGGVRTVEAGQRLPEPVEEERAGGQVGEVVGQRLARALPAGPARPRADADGPILTGATWSRTATGTLMPAPQLSTLSCWSVSRKPHRTSSINSSMRATSVSRMSTTGACSATSASTRA